MKTYRIFTLLILSISMVSKGFAYDPFYAQKALRNDQNSRKHFTGFSKNFAKTLHLKLLHPGGVGCIVDDRKVLWASKFMALKPVTKEQARPSLELAFSRLWKEVKADAEFDDYLLNKSLDYKRPKRALAPELIGLRIDFWDENVNRYSFPFLAKVIIKGTHIYYYYADPVSQALQDPVIEELPRWVFNPS
ncbi:MAG: hypothetical protein ACSNEK_04070 [Parachlamydiaceae bacterium]